MKLHLLTPSILIRTILSMSIAALVACKPNPVNHSFTKPLKTETKVETLPIISQLAPEQPRFATQLHQMNIGGIRFNLVSFDTRDCSLEVADQPNGPGSLWDNAELAANKKNALVALNAGFFTPEGKPLGLVIENGTKRGAYNASSLGKGIYYTNASETRISRSHNWRKILKTNPKYLLQAGPMLVDKGSSTHGLSTQSSRPRSFLATDDQNHWIMGHASASTLSQLGKALDNLKIDNFTVVSAINLDGGRSSELWVSEEISNRNSSLLIRPFWNKPVRNYLLLKRK